MSKSPILAWTSSRAILMPLTIVWACALALPVRGRLETILMMSGRAETAARKKARLSNRFMADFYQKTRNLPIRRPRVTSCRMLKQQQTIKRAVSFSGPGIHTGNKVSMTWKPAPVDRGIKFVRVDLEGKPEIEPHIRNLSDTTRWTTIGSNGAVIHTVEHVLATLTGYGIDNVLIELDGNEPPVNEHVVD